MSLVAEHVYERLPRPGVPAAVAGVQLDIMDDEEITAIAAATIETGDRVWLDGEARPLTGGLLDLRLAAMERTLACGTCGGMADTCPGHVGAMPLARAIFTPATLPVALLVLRAHCHGCGQLLIWGAKRDAAIARARRISASFGGRLAALRTLWAAASAGAAVCRPHAADGRCGWWLRHDAAKLQADNGRQTRRQRIGGWLAVASAHGPLAARRTSAGHGIVDDERRPFGPRNCRDG